MTLVTSSVLANTVGQTELMKLTASDAGEEDHFGISVAVSGDTAVIGAFYHDYGAVDIGSAYVFRFDGSDWSEEEKLTPSDGAAEDHFGVAVAVSGDTIVVGSIWDDDDGSYSGSAYVFRFDGSEWVEEEKLTASDAEAYDYFGGRVAVSGDTAVVGASNFAGSAYVFRYDGSDWVEEEKLVASDGASGDNFGDSVAIPDGTVVVGANADDDNGTDSGSAYVFHYDGSDWVEDAKLTASDGAAFDAFSCTVAVSGDTAVVGASSDDDNGDRSGSAYLFRYDGSDWVESAKLTASDGAESDFFGGRVAVSGSTSIIGAAGDDGDLLDDTGSAYVFAVSDPSAIFMDDFENGTTSAWTIVVP